MEYSLQQQNNYFKNLNSEQKVLNIKKRIDNIRKRNRWWPYDKQDVESKPKSNLDLIKEKLQQASQ